MALSKELSRMGEEVEQAAEELMEAAQLKAGQILVVGCSTSEVLGEKIGSAGSEQVADVIFQRLQEVCSKRGIYLAIQCCEHLNRALVVERKTQKEYSLDPVWVIPVRQAGGALAAQAMRNFKDAVVVEQIKAHGGLDIGCTLIGMHLQPVAVPVRLKQKTIGQAMIVAARTRPKLIGGARAVYE